MRPNEYLQKSWKASWSEGLHFRRAAEAYRQAVAVWDAIPHLEEAAKTLKAPGDLSAKGLTDRLKEKAAKDVAPTIARARHAVQQARSEAKAMRESFRIAAPDPSDLAGAIRRMELRTWMRTLGPMEAFALLVNEETPRDMLVAAFEMPAQVSGLTKEQLADLEQAYIARTYAKELEAVEELEEAAQVAQNGLEMAQGYVGEALGYELSDPSQRYEFDAWLREAQASTSSELEASEARPMPVMPEHARAVAKVINDMDRDMLDQLSSFIIDRRLSIGLNTGPSAIPEFA